MMTVMLIKFGLFLSVQLTSYAYPSGPPKSACSDGMPVHIKDGKAIPPQNTSSPFVINVNSTSIKPGDTVRVKIHSDQGEMFRGIFIQVHPVPNKEGDIVKYAAPGLFDRKITNVKILTCTIMLDTLGHEDSFMKIETSFDWRSPLFLKHDVVVRATILKDFSTYWHNVESPRIEVDKDETLPVEKLEKPWLEEIIKTVKNEDDVKIRRELVRARFEKGFRNALDPNGFIMINYVTNLLPFEDSPVPIIAVSKESNDKNVTANMTLLGNVSESNEMNNETKKIIDGTESKASNQSQTVNQTSTNDASAKVGNRIKAGNSSGEEFSHGQDTIDTTFVHRNETIDMSNVKNKSMMENYYHVLVRSLLKGDQLVADTLSEIIEKN